MDFVSMDTVGIMNLASQKVNGFVGSVRKSLTGSVKPVQPSTSLCQHSEPEFQSCTYSLSPASLTHRSVTASLDGDEYSSVAPTHEHSADHEPATRETEEEFYECTLELKTDQPADQETFLSLPSTESEYAPEPSSLTERSGLSPEKDETVFHSATSLVSEDKVSDEEFHDAETFTPSSQSSALVQTALHTQQAIHNDLEDVAPEALLEDLHHHTILVAQFRREKKETIALLETRVKALEKDIETTFSRFSGRKKEAKAEIQKLIHNLEQLKQHQTEKTLNELLDGILNYETKFEKVSWLLLSSLAFLNITESGHLTQLKELIPHTLLETGTSGLLNPEAVCKFTCTMTGSRHNQADLIGLIRNIISLRKNTDLIQQLDTGLLGSPDQMRSPMQAMQRVIETQPVLAGKLLAGTFHDCQHSDDPAIKANGEAYKEMFAATPAVDGTQYLQACLEKFNGLFDGLLAVVGGLTQAQYIQQQGERLRQETAELLEQKKILTQQQYQSMLNKARQLKSMAEAQGYNPRQINGQIREIRKLSAQGVIQAMAEGEPLWHLDTTTDADPEVHLQLVTAAIHGKDNHPYADAIRKLYAYLNSANSGLMEDFKEELRLKDELLLSQQKYILDQARASLGQEQRFRQLSLMAQTLETLRPNPMLLCKESSPTAVATRLGRSTLTPQALPFVHQIKELNLMHELAVQGYCFEDEALKLCSALPEMADNLWSTGEQVYTDGKALVSAISNGEMDAAKALRAVGQFSTEATQKLTKDFQDILTGAAALGKTNPRLLRALWGNFDQTLAVIANTTGSNSTLYSVFNELKSRVGAEAYTQYFIDNLDSEPVDLKSLKPEELEAVKRLVTLNRLLTSGPCFIHILNAALGTVQSAGNPITMACTWARAGFNIIYSRLVQTNVNAMDGKSVQALNTLIDTLTEGPAYAAHRQQVMERCGQIMADIACRRPVLGALSHTPIVSKFFSIYPFRALGRRLKESFQNWWKGRPGGRMELGIMLLKCAPVVALPAGALLPVIFAGNVVSLVTAGGVFIGSLWGAHGWAKHIIHYAGMTDIAIVVARHVGLQLQQPGINFMDKAGEMLEQQDYASHIRLMAENHTHAAITDGYWETWSQANKQKADKARQDIEQSVEQDFQTNPKLFNRLKQVMHALQYLQSTKPEAIREEQLKMILPPEDVPALPAVHHRIYWVQMMQEQLHDEMFSAIGYDDRGRDRIPGSEQELEDRLKCSIVKRLCGAMLLSECEEARKGLDHQLKLYTNILLERARNRMGTCMAKMVEQGMTTVYMHRARQYRGREECKINPDDFNKAVTDDDRLQEAMKHHFQDVILAVIMKSCTFYREVIKRHLREQQLTEEQIQKVLAQK